MQIDQYAPFLREIEENKTLERYVKEMHISEEESLKKVMSLASIYVK
jgi:hypothetical protein